MEQNEHSRAEIECVLALPAYLGGNVEVLVNYGNEFLSILQLGHHDAVNRFDSIGY